MGGGGGGGGGGVGGGGGEVLSKNIIFMLYILFNETLCSLCHTFLIMYVESIQIHIGRDEISRNK